MYLFTLQRSAYGGGSSSQYAYNNWSPPAQSNETSNGYVLERSQSAKMCLAKALEFCPEEVCSYVTSYDKLTGAISCLNDFS